MGVSIPLRQSLVTDLLDNCAYRAGLTSVLGMDDGTSHPAEVGTYTHHFVDLYLRILRNLGDEHEALEGMWNDFDIKVPDEYRDEVKAALEHWLETPYDHWFEDESRESLCELVRKWTPLSLETHFNMYLPYATQLPLQGTPDALYRDDQGQLVLVDLKTTRNISKYSQKNLGTSLRDQAAMYVAAMRYSGTFAGFRVTDTAELPRFEYHIIRPQRASQRNFIGSRRLVVSMEPADLDYLESRLAKAEEIIVTGDYQKNPDSWICSPKWCAFHIEGGGHCNPYGPNEYTIGAA